MYDFLIQKFLCWQCPPCPIIFKMSTTKFVNVKNMWWCHDVYVNKTSRSDDRQQKFWHQCLILTLQYFYLFIQARLNLQSLHPFLYYSISKINSVVLNCLFPSFLLSLLVNLSYFFNEFMFYVSVDKLKWTVLNYKYHITMYENNQITKKPLEWELLLIDVIRVSYI